MKPSNFKLDKDKILNNLSNTTTLKTPLYKNFPKNLGITGESGFAGNIILNDSDNLFYGHNGIEWAILNGGGSGGGSTGPTGPAGLGETGPTGPAGLGETGPTGPAGLGETGPTGPAGLGETGPTGPAGLGETGPTGPAGLGETGPTGPAGLGETGPTGPAGLGETGPTGPTGPSLGAITAVDRLLIYVDSTGDNINDVSLNPNFTAPLWPNNVVNTLTINGYINVPVWENVNNPVLTIDRALELVRQNGWNDLAIIVVGSTAPVLGSLNPDTKVFNSNVGNRGYQRTNLQIIGFLDDTEQIQITDSFVNGRIVPDLTAQQDVGFATVEPIQNAQLQTLDGNIVQSNVNGPLVIDFTPMSNTTGNYNGTRILVKDGINIGFGPDQRLNGIWQIVDSGSSSSPWIIQRVTGFQADDVIQPDLSWFVQQPVFQITNISFISSTPPFDTYEITTATPHVFYDGDFVYLYSPDFVISEQDSVNPIFIITSPSSNTFRIVVNTGNPFQQVIVNVGPTTGNCFTYVSNGLQPQRTPIVNRNSLFTIPPYNVNNVSGDTITVANFDPAPSTDYNYTIRFRFKGNVDNMLQLVSNGGFGNVNVGDCILFSNDILPIYPNTPLQFLVAEKLDNDNIYISCSEGYINLACRRTTPTTIRLVKRQSTIIFSSQLTVYSNSNFVLYRDLIFSINNFTSPPQFANYFIIHQINLQLSNVELFNNNVGFLFIVCKQANIVTSSLNVSGEFRFNNNYIDIVGNGLFLTGLYINTPQNNITQITGNGAILGLSNSVVSPFSIIELRGSSFESSFNTVYYRGLTIFTCSDIEFKMNNVRFINSLTGDLFDNALLRFTGSSNVRLSNITIRYSEVINEGFFSMIEADNSNLSLNTLVMYNIKGQGSGPSSFNQILLLNIQNSLVTYSGFFNDRFSSSIYVQGVQNVQAISCREGRFSIREKPFTMYDITGEYSNNFSNLVDLENSTLNCEIDIDSGFINNSYIQQLQNTYLKITSSKGSINCILNGPLNINSPPTPNTFDNGAVFIENSNLILSNSINNAGISIGGFRYINPPIPPNTSSKDIVLISSSNVNGGFNNYGVLLNDVIITNNNETSTPGRVVVLISNSHLTRPQNITALGLPDPLQCGANLPSPFTFQNDYIQPFTQNCSYTIT
jgi:hypothetical protein